MIKVHMSELMGKKGIRNMSEISRTVGIDRRSLTNLCDGKVTGVEFRTLEALCGYFNCGVGDLIEYVAEKG